MSNVVYSPPPRVVNIFSFGRAEARFDCQQQRLAFVNWRSGALSIRLST
jgi:hypothetical protein